MKFAKLINNAYLEYAPDTYIRDDGAIIVNFNKSEALMRKYGFKPVIENEPTYNPETEYLTITGYIENENEIVSIYTINQYEVTEKPISLEEKVTKLETEDLWFKEELAMTQAMVNDLIINTVDGGIK